MSETPSARVHRFVSNDFTLRIAAVNATAVVSHMQSLQGTLPIATIGVGRAMVAAALMASHLKDGQEVGLLFRGNGPLGSLYAEAGFDGQIRGYCPHPTYIPPQQEDQLNLGKALGNGTLSVVRHAPFQRQPFHGTVGLVSGEIGDDVAHYLHQSQQIRSIVSVGVYLDQLGKARAAGGVLIEVMPGVEDEIVNRLQANADKIKVPASKLLFEGNAPEQLVVPYLEGIAFTEIPHPYELRYACPCTVERVKRALTTLGDTGLNEMIDEAKEARITCQVCGKGYAISVDELIVLRDELRRNSMH